MKKIKFQFDKAKLKSFFLLHGEKVGLGLFGLVFLWLVYSGLTLETYERVPSELESAASRAQQHVERQSFDAQTEGFVFTDPAELVALSSEQVDPAAFRIEPFDPPLWPASKRGEPEFLAVEDLVVTPGFGTFRMPEGGGDNGARFKAYRWACITGLIPYDEQIAAYQAAIGREAPEPQYIYPIVYRADVTSSAAEPKWEALDFRKMNADFIKWRAQAEAPLVDKAFLVPEPNPAFPMAFPLGPLADRKWQLEQVVHPKLVEIIQAADAPEKEEPAEPENALDAHDPEALFREEQPRDNRNANRNRPARDNARAEDKKPEKGSPIRLFRYFDFTVQPGRQYQYRVIVNLRNPNGDVQPHELADPKFAEGTYRSTAPSQPSATVAIPFDSEIVFGEVVPPRGMNEIAVKTIVAQRDPTGRTAIAEREMFRGALGNFEAEQVRMEEPGRGQAAVEPSVRFRTDTLIVDIQSASAEDNTSVVCLTPDGRLQVRTQRNDAAQFVEFQQRLNGQTPAKPPGEAAPANPEQPKPDDLLSSGS